MKRLLAVLVALAILAAPRRASAQQIPVGPGSDLSSLVGLPIDVPFVADMSARSERLGSFALRIQWDTTRLRLVWGTDGSFGAVRVNSDSQAVGVVRLAGVNPGGATGRVTLAVARLTPLVRDTTTLLISLTELYAAGTYADLRPSAVVANGVYCPARGRWGDIDGDGYANSRDALIALTNAVGLDVGAFDVSLGDVDGSGTTNTRDALIVLSDAVGVDVSAFRVLQLATGACAANAARALTIVPASLEMVVGQAVRFEARAGDAAGVLQAIADVTWRSDRPAVLDVQPDGSGVARDTGVAVVIVRRGTRDSAQAAVHVVARRTTHWVDARAAGATNRLGTPSLPFATLNEGVRFAQAGDTVRVRVGAYDLNVDGEGTLVIDKPMVVLGDTAADGSRPAIAGTPGIDGVVFGGPGSVEIHNFDVTGFARAFVVSGPSRALVRGVRVSQVASGLFVAAQAGWVRIERSRMVGPGPVGEGYGGIGVEANAIVDTLTVEDTEISDFGYGIYDTAMRIDSLTIRRSVLHDAGFASVYVFSQCYYGCVQPAPGASRPVRQGSQPRVPAAPQQTLDGAPTSQAVVIEASRLARTFSRSALVNLATVLRRAVFAHSTFTNPQGSALSVMSLGAGHLAMTGDSIVAPPDQQHYQWLDARDLDSLGLDSVVAVGSGIGDVYRTPLVRVSNSTFRDVRGYGMQVIPSVDGAVVRFDNVGIYGDPRDDVAATGLLVGGSRATIDRLTAVNLADGVNAVAGDSSTTVTNSLFQHVTTPVMWSSSGALAPSPNGLTVRNTTFRGFYLAVEVNDGRLVADSNTFVNGFEAISAIGSVPIVVSRNQVSGTDIGVEIWNTNSSAAVTVSDNAVSGVTNRGIYAEGGLSFPDTIQTALDVRRNTVTCAGVGATSAVGIELRTAHVVAAGNQVNGCFAGLVTAQFGGRTRTDSILGNTVTIPASGQVGIGVTGLVSALVRRNAVSGAATGQQVAGLIDVASCPPYAGCPESNVPTAIVDSNLVTGGTVWGIHAQGVDSLDVVANRVENLNLASGAYSAYGEEKGAIAVFGYLQTFARIAGNIIRHIAGNGIVVAHSSGTTVSVDSNVVADVDSSGLSYQSSFGIGPVTITRNLFTGARREGLRISGYAAATATDNNIAGNVFGVRVVSDRNFDAPNNWWGAASGPSCSFCDGTGDSVSGVNFSPFRVAPNASVPPLPAPAPWFLAESRAVPPMRAALSTGPLDARIESGERLGAPGVRRAQPTRAAPSPTGAGPLAERRAAEERDRETLEARRAARLQQLHDRTEALRRARQTTSAPRAPRSQEVRP